MNRRDFERKVKRVNPRFSVRLRRGVFSLMDKDRYGRPYTAMEITGRQPTGEDVKKVYFGEKVRRDGMFVMELDRIRDRSDARNEEIKRMRMYETVEKSKDFSKYVSKMADEQGAPAEHRPTAAEEGWKNRVVM